MARRQANDISERRTEFVGCQVTPSERADVDAARAATGETLSDFIRRRVISPDGQPPAPPADTKATRDLVVALTKIGVNLNQLTKLAHELHALPREKEFKEVAEKIMQAIEVVISP